MKYHLGWLFSNKYSLCQVGIPNQCGGDCCLA